MAALGIAIVPGTVAALEIDGERLAGVRLSDGTLVSSQAVVVSPRVTVRARFLAALGLRVAEHPAGVGEYIPSEPGGRTDVPGVFVAGNVTDPSAQVGAAAAAGAFAGAQINADLVAEEVRGAVAAAGLRASWRHDTSAAAAAGRAR